MCAMPQIHQASAPRSLIAAEIDHRRAACRSARGCRHACSGTAASVPPVSRALMVVGDIASLLLGRRRDAGHRLSVRAGDGHGVADRENLGMAGDGQVGLDLQPAGAVGRCAEPFGGGRSAHAGGPDDGLGVQPLAAIDDAVAVHSVTGCPSIDLDADLSSERLRIGREIVGESLRARADLLRSAPRALCAYRCCGSRCGNVCCASSAMVPASSTPVGPAPIMTKVKQRRAPLRIGLALGALEGDQDAPPQRRRVLQRLQPRRERLPFVMAEIGVARAGREHQRVVGQCCRRHRAARAVPSDRRR